MNIKCPECGEHFSAAEHGSKRDVECPQCGLTGKVV